MVTCAEMFIAKLDEKKFLYSVRDLNDGGVSVSVPFNGMSTSLYFAGSDGGTHVAFSTLIEKCPADRIGDMLILLNSLNAHFRWLKFYVDGDNNVTVEDDAIVTPETAGEECFELIVRTVNILEEAKPKIMRVIYA